MTITCGIQPTNVVTMVIKVLLGPAALMLVHSYQSNHPCICYNYNMYMYVSMYEWDACMHACMYVHMCITLCRQWIC